MIHSPPLQAIFFDIDDTLFSTSSFAEKARKRSIDSMIRLGWKVDPEKAYQELLEVIAEFSPNYGSHFDKLVLRMGESCSEGINSAILIAQAIVSYHDAKNELLHPYPEVLPFFRMLAKTNLALGIITDGLTIKQSEKIIRLGIYPFLNPRFIFISEQLGISKPNPKIYQFASQRCRIPTNQIMYIGDNPNNDIVPANKVGMITVRYVRDGKHRQTSCTVSPTHEIQNFEQLREILKNQYQIELKE
ncbi:MAG: HAD-IA family hydrolase [Planctomycetota bacterium]